MTMVSVQYWSIFVDLYTSFTLPLRLVVLFAVYLKTVEGDWVTCQITMFLDCTAGVVAINMFLEPLA